MPDVIAGRIWLFGNDLDTDVMLPGRVIFRPEAEQVRALFADLRPGWVDCVGAGDIIVAGRNFGLGSSRPVQRALIGLGIACVVAESFAGLFLRGCVSYGLPALACPGAVAAFAEGDSAEVDLEAAVVRNPSIGIALKARPLPEDLLKLMTGGGILPQLEAQGLLSAPVR